MNIVFDLGGVVFNWQPDLLAQNAFPDTERQRLTRHDIIGHPDWLALDQGTLSLDAAIDNAVARTGITKAEVANFFAKAPASLSPIQPTIALIHELADNAQHPLFVLSNMHHAAIDYLEANHDVFERFQARVVSCRIGMIKPQPEIFDYLLETNGLNAADTLFIDDMPANTEAAAARGLQTIQFKDTASCRLELERLGYL